MEKVRYKLRTPDQGNQQSLSNLYFLLLIVLLFSDTIGFNMENELLQYVKKHKYEDSLAVVFNGNVKETPKKLSYDIRVNQPYIRWNVPQRFVSTYEYQPDQGLFCCLFVC